MKSLRRHSDGHILEVSKSQADQWIQAMELCRRRILSESRLEDDEVFGDRLFRLEVEIHFFLVALLRYYRAISLAISKLPESGPLQQRLSTFHTYIGIKRTMRNVGEHFDEYLDGRGRDQSVDRGGLQVWSMDVTEENVRFDWLEETFDLKSTMKEAENLWVMFLEPYKAHCKMLARDSMPALDRNRDRPQ